MRISRLLTACACFLALHCAHAFSLADLSNKEASSGLKEALSRGASYAVSSLGQPNGFLGNEKVKIPLPAGLDKLESTLRTFGMGKYADDLEVTMNQAAEKAVQEAKPVLLNAINKMSVQDAKGILTGGEDAATQYFKRTTSSELTQKFLPIVQKSTANLQLADKYNKLAGKAANFGLLDPSSANLDSYVTQKALDGLFLMVAEQEKQIRQDPIGTGSKMLQKVFGVLQ